MENFEGGGQNPEIKDKLPFGKRLRLAAAILIGTVSIPATFEPKPEVPTEIRSGDPPTPTSAPVQPKNI